jgi:hypothetical protein
MELTIFGGRQRRRESAKGYVESLTVFPGANVRKICKAQ